MIPISLGRIVHAVIQDKRGELITRPAIVVQVWDETIGSANLQVFLDGVNDTDQMEAHGPIATMWKTSALYSEEPKLNTWHWPPKV